VKIFFHRSFCSLAEGLGRFLSASLSSDESAGDVLPGFAIASSSLRKLKKEKKNNFEHSSNKKIS
jgi:hypothetical protein